MPQCTVLQNAQRLDCNGEFARGWGSLNRRRAKDGAGRDDSAADAEAELQGAECLFELLALLGAAPVVIDEALAKEELLLLEQLEWIHRILAPPQLGQPALGDLRLSCAVLGGCAPNARAGAVELALPEEAGEGIHRPELALLERLLERRQRPIQLGALERLLNQAILEERQLLLHQIRRIRLSGSRGQRLFHPLVSRRNLSLTKLSCRSQHTVSSLPDPGLGQVRVRTEADLRCACGDGLRGGAWRDEEAQSKRSQEDERHGRG